MPPPGRAQFLAPLRHIVETGGGYAVLTQLVASISSLVISLMLLRFLSIDDFGHFTYLFLFASFASAVTASITGNVYHYWRPRLPKLSTGYEKNYNGLHLIVVSVVCSLVSVAYLSGPQTGKGPGVTSCALFIFSLALSDNAKLQVAANGMHRQMFFTEFARQSVVTVSILLVGWLGWADLSLAVTIVALAGLGAWIALCGVLHFKVSFRRLKWVFVRHWSYARNLLPAVVISTVHISGLQIATLWHFGPSNVGLLRTAEMPYSAINPLRLALPQVLPAYLHRLEADRLAGRTRHLARTGLIVFSAAAAIVLCVWLAGAVLMPWLTRKNYPAGLGLIYAAMYIMTLLNGTLQIYLNVVRRSSSVLRQAILGAIVAVVIYLAASPIIGVYSAPIASLTAIAAMTLLGTSDALRHIYAAKVRPA